MDKKKIIIYLLLGFCGLSVILGLILTFKQSSKIASSTTQGRLDFSTIGKEGIAVVYIYGEIFVEKESSVFPGFSYGADQIVERLKKIAKNKKVKAVVLRINSPGGGTAASQEIYEEVKKLRQSGKKIVVSMGDVAASGGYYISCAADRIVANPSTLTGSIGVIMHFGNMQELLRKIGVKIEVIKSGDNKDIGAFWRAPSPAELKLLQGMIENSYEQFLKVVAEGRNMPLEEVRKFADGSVFTGEQALDKKMIDQLGNLPDAIQLAADLAGMKGEPYIIKDYAPMEKFMEFFSRNTEDNSISKIVNKTETRLAYLMK